MEQFGRWEPKVRAWVLLDSEAAEAQAEQLQQEAERTGWRSPLHGLPLGVKDIFDVAGWPTKAGSPLREHHLAATDAPLVARLRRAGAILLGKTVTTQFACFDPPITRNPWHLDHTPGGSSSGSAAAVAAGMAWAALGSQTGGSLTRPASYCGVASFKPTWGRLSTASVVPISSTLDHPGPIAASAADLKLLAAVLGGEDCQACERRLASLQPPRPDTLTIGMLEHETFDQATDEVKACLQEVRQRLETARVQVRSVRLPAVFGEIPAMHRRVMFAEAAWYHRENFPAQRNAYAAGMQQLLEEGLSISAVDYQIALRHREQLWQELPAWMEGCDAWLCPATMSAAPQEVTTTGSPNFQLQWSYLGWPTVSLPLHTQTNRLPLGIQLIGLPHSDERLLSIACGLEAFLGGALVYNGPLG